MTFEGVQVQGAARIMEKISGLTFQKIAHVITAVDCQPSFDGGILINVLGQLKVIETTILSLISVHSFGVCPVKENLKCSTVSVNNQAFRTPRIYLSKQILLSAEMMFSFNLYMQDSRYLRR